MTALGLRIVGRNLPGRTWGDHEHVHVGLQRGRSAVSLTPGDAREAVFDLTVAVTASAARVSARSGAAGVI